MLLNLTGKQIIKQADASASFVKSVTQLQQFVWPYFWVIIVCHNEPNYVSRFPLNKSISADTRRKHLGYCPVVQCLRGMGKGVALLIGSVLIILLTKGGEYNHGST